MRFALEIYTRESAPFYGDPHRDGQGEFFGMVKLEEDGPRYLVLDSQNRLVTKLDEIFATASNMIQEHIDG